MYPTSYSRADVSRSGSENARFTLYIGGVAQTNDWHLLGGSMSVNASGRIRRTSRVALLGNYPEINSVNCEFKLEKAINDEYVPIGVFRVEDPKIAIDRNGAITTFEGYDRFHLLQQLRLPAPYTIPHLTPLDQAIANLIGSRYPSLPIQFDSTSYKVQGTTFEEQTDPLEKAIDMAKSGGMDLYVDVNGAARLTPVVDIDSSKVDITFGTEARILKSDQGTSARNTYNHAIAIGEHPSLATPLRSEAFDDNPTSLTYYLGDFLDRPTWIRSQFISSQAQCDAAAKALLLRSSGRIQQIGVTGIPDPALDANDVLRLYQSDYGVDVIASVESFTMQLFGGDMPITTRERKVA